MTADLHDLLEDAVSDVEPRDRLTAIRSRTRRRRRTRRAWTVTGAVTATAALVVAAVVAPGLLGQDSPDVAQRDEDVVGAAYFLDRENTGGSGPDAGRFVLRREFRPLPEIDGVDGPLAALMYAPVDPDYFTPWGAGSFESATVADDAIEVEIGPQFDRVLLFGGDPDSPDLQMVVWTLQAAFDRDDLPVQFTDGGEPQGAPVVRAPQGDVLADVNISDPAEGTVVRSVLDARGRARSPEGTVPWQIRDSGGSVVLDGFTTAAGSYDQLYEWDTTIDVSELEPGTYTFVASTDDPSGGTEGLGPSSDTRTIVVE